MGQKFCAHHQKQNGRNWNGVAICGIWERTFAHYPLATIAQKGSCASDVFTHNPKKALCHYFNKCMQVILVNWLKLRSVVSRWDKSLLDD